jgi:hypothetical protein
MASAGERTAQLKYQCLAANKWSNYPATRDVEMACNSIQDVSSMTFCDGTYMGPGGSFDISSGEPIVIKTANASGSTTMTLGPSAGIVSIVGDVSNGVLNMGSTAPGAATSVEIASAGLLPSMFGSFPGARLLNGLIKETFGGPAAGVFITKPIKLLGTLEVRNFGDETGSEKLQLSYDNTTDIGQILVSSGTGKLVLEGQGGGVELKVPTVPQGDLILTGVPNVTTTTANDVGLKASSAGKEITKYLKVKLGAGYIWIPYLETDPSL